MGSATHIHGVTRKHSSNGAKAPKFLEHLERFINDSSVCILISGRSSNHQQTLES